jgi:hypothetical protein
MVDVRSPIFALAAGVGLWLVIVFLIGQFSDWAALAGEFRSTENFTGSRWHLQSGQFRWLGSYNNCLTVGADPRGLYLSVFPLFRPGHPPLFIPWNEITVSRRKVLWIRQVRFLLGHGLQIPLTVREGLEQKIQGAAGSSWPREAIPS